MNRILILAALLLTACHSSLPPVPQTNRKVVEPSGSTGTVKSWNQVTKQENDAVLPFGQERR